MDRSTVIPAAPTTVEFDDASNPVVASAFFPMAAGYTAHAVVFIGKDDRAYSGVIGHPNDGEDYVLDGISGRYGHGVTRHVSYPEALDKMRDLVALLQRR